MSNGVNVELGSNEDNSRFALLSTAPSVAKCEDILPKGYFTLNPACSSSGKVIDIAGGSSSNGANAQINDCNGTLAQLFSFEYHDGYYLIRNAKSQKALDVAGGELIPGSNIQQWACDDVNANRLFAAVDNGDGTFSFVSKSTGLVLDVVGASDSAQANLDAYLPNGSSAQKFSLHQVGAFTFESTTALKVLDVSGDPWRTTLRFSYMQSNDTLAQKWYVSKVSG